MKNLALFVLILFLLKPIFSIGQIEISPEDKILEIDESVHLYMNLENVDYDYLESRLSNISVDELEALKKTIKQEEINRKKIDFFKQNFSEQEIDSLYYWYNGMDMYSSYQLDISHKKTKIGISASLNKKRDSLFRVLFFQGIDDFKKLQANFYRLGSINYLRSEKKHGIDEKSKFKKINRINGLYEVLSFRKKARHQQEFFESIRVRNKPSLHFKSLQNIAVELESGGFNYNVVLSFREDAVAELGRVTRNNINKPLAIIVNKNLVSAPFTFEPVDNGKFVIKGGFKLDEALKLAKRINDYQIYK